MVVIATQIRPAASERGEPRRRPLGRRLETPLPTGLGEHSANTLVGQLVHEASQLVTLGAHINDDTGQDRRPEAKPQTRRCSIQRTHSVRAKPEP